MLQAGLLSLMLLICVAVGRPQGQLDDLINLRDEFANSVDNKEIIKDVRIMKRDIEVDFSELNNQIKTMNDSELENNEADLNTKQIEEEQQVKNESGRWEEGKLKREREDRKRASMLESTLARRETKRSEKIKNSQNRTGRARPFPSRPPTTSAPTVNITALTPQVNVIKSAGGGLEALVVWFSPVNFENEIIGKGAKYSVHWARETCNFARGWPHCSEPGVYNHREILSAEKQITLTLTGLTYNSEYWVQCEIKEGSSPRVKFVTPPCGNPSQDFRSCTVAKETTSVTSSNQVFIPEITCLGYDQSRDVGVVGITWPHHGDVIKSSNNNNDDDDYSVSYHSDSSVLRRKGFNNMVDSDISSENLDNEKTINKNNDYSNRNINNINYNSSSNEMLQLNGGQLGWGGNETGISQEESKSQDGFSTTGNKEQEQVEDWESMVSVRYATNQGIHMDMHRTESWRIELDLEPEKMHEIRIRAAKQSKEIIYEPLYVNVTRNISAELSELKHKYPVCPVRKMSPSTSELRSQTTKPISLVFIGLLALSVMVFIVLISVILLKRFWRTYTPLKGSSVCKTISVRNNGNNYRATPQASPCLSFKLQQQLLLQREEHQFEAAAAAAAEPCEIRVAGQATLAASVSCGLDEWELDANEVTLGVEIGQGAFGLVMTGIYKSKQVAIKVVKDDLSTGYREELLREIALMKRLGTHPNIVSLIGACTIKEPIALIMEYMPYGNLQTFLQKCRLEGEVQRGLGGGPTAVSYCPLDQYTGSSEYWSITPTDMLSFARQMSLAMEFLAERKYVHCDLAARNVLVGSGKIVKLCDFGLARLVHNGDQYYKLSNGRLPLKWMAIESIRDRVFTVQTDVWAYGVALWEITTFGASPYSNIALVDLYKLLCNGYRLEQPENCSDELYDIMCQCWFEDPRQRTSFTSVRHQLENLLSQSSNYLTLEGLDSSAASSPSVDSTETFNIRHHSTDGSELCTNEICRVSLQRIENDSGEEGTSNLTEVESMPRSPRSPGVVSLNAAKASKT